MKHFKVKDEKILCVICKKEVDIRETTFGACKECKNRIEKDFSTFTGTTKY